MSGGTVGRRNDVQPLKGHLGNIFDGVERSWVIRLSGWKKHVKLYMQSDYNYVEINGGKGWDTKKGQRKAIWIHKCSQEEKKKRGRRMSGREGAGTGQERAWPALHCGADVAQMCPALCGPMDCSLPGFSVHGISQGRILEWVAMPSSRGSSWPRDRTRISCVS